jgi:hypothetical protein
LSTSVGHPKKCTNYIHLMNLLEICQKHAGLVKCVCVCVCVFCIFGVVTKVHNCPVYWPGRQGYYCVQIHHRV